MTVLSHSKNPLLKLVVYFIIGVSIAIYFSLTSWVYFLFLFLSLISSLLIENNLIRTVFSINKLKFIQEGLLFISLFFAGIVVSIAHHDSLYPDYYGKVLVRTKHLDKTTSLVEIDNAIQVKKKSIQCKVSINSIKILDSTISVLGKAMVYLPKNKSTLLLLPGDKLEISSNWSTLKSPKNPGQFNYKNYLKFHEIEWVNYVKDDQYKFCGSNFYNIKRYAVIARNICIDLFKKSSLKNQNLAIASALTFGYKDELDSSTKHAFSSTGAMHVLAVSGLHVGIVFLIIQFILDIFPLLFRRSWMKYSIILLFMWSYALLTGLSPSVLRATTMLSFVVLGLMFNRNSSVYNSLAASAFFLLLINPFLVMQVGFQLSFLAVLGILFIQPKIENAYKPKQYILKKIWTLITVSIAAQCATFPLGILYFHQFPNYFILSNLIVIPMAFVILFLGILLLVSSKFDYLFQAVGEILNLVVEWLKKSVNYIDHLPLALTDGVSISILETFLFYIIIIFVLLFLISYRWIFFYVSILLLSFTLIIDYQENLVLSSQKKLIVYHTKEPVIIDLISSNKHYFISSKEFFKDEDQLLFNVKHNWYDNDLLAPTFIDSDSIVNRRILFSDKKLIYLTENPSDYSLKNDVVLLSGNKELNYNDLLINDYARLYVLMNDMSNNQKLVFKKKCNGHSSDYYDLKQKGAFELSW